MLKLNRRKAIAIFCVLALGVIQVAFIPQAYSAVPVESKSSPKGINQNTSVIQTGIDNNQFTYLDQEAGAFAIFNHSDFDVPLEFGRFRKDEGSFEIESLRGIRADASQYFLTDYLDPHFLAIIERLPQGGFGRLLRYRGPVQSGRWADLEFIYEDRENKITILDYESGNFFRTTFETQVEPSQLFPVSEDDNNALDFKSIISPPLKFMISRAPQGNLSSNPSGSLRSFPHSTSGFDVWMKRLVRGPPAGGAFL